VSRSCQGKVAGSVVIYVRLGRAESDTKLGSTLNRVRVDFRSSHGCSCNEGGHKYLSQVLVGCLVMVASC
jgi:hypothetical protein